MSGGAVETAGAEGAPTGRRPDFLLIGAMRAGTTTLHRLLAAHPRIFIPEPELFFLALDDFEEHAESWVGRDGAWRVRDFERELERERPAWEANFAEAGDRICGEDSTTYLTAARAPERAARLLPGVRAIAILRDPADRAWSHYWHLVNSGRAVLDFDSALLSHRGTLLKRGEYAAGLARWFSALGRDRVRVLIFEEMIQDLAATVEAVLAFLGVDGALDIGALPLEDRHRHRGTAPADLALRLRVNHSARFPIYGGRPTLPVRRPGGLEGARLRWAGDMEIPPMPAATRAVLDAVFRRVNAGLPEMLGRAPPWGCFAPAAR